MVKKKAALPAGKDMDVLLKHIADKYSGEKISTIDGVKIDFEEGWVHLRKSNTEPVIRIYSESVSHERSEELASRFASEILKK
jgi:phosphomannomutase